MFQGGARGTSYFLQNFLLLNIRINLFIFYSKITLKFTLINFAKVPVSPKKEN